MISRFVKVDVVLEDPIASDYITLKAFVIFSASHKYCRTELEKDRRRVPYVNQNIYKILRYFR